MMMLMLRREYSRRSQTNKHQIITIKGNPEFAKLLAAKLPKDSQPINPVYTPATIQQMFTKNHSDLKGTFKATKQGIQSELKKKDSQILDVLYGTVLNPPKNHGLIPNGAISEKFNILHYQLGVLILFDSTKITEQALHGELQIGSLSNHCAIASEALHVCANGETLAKPFKVVVGSVLGINRLDISCGTSLAIMPFEQSKSKNFDLSCIEAFIKEWLATNVNDKIAKLVKKLRSEQRNKMPHILFCIENQKGKILLLLVRYSALNCTHVEISDIPDLVTFLRDIEITAATLQKNRVLIEDIVSAHEIANEINGQKITLRFEANCFSKLHMLFKVLQQKGARYIILTGIEKLFIDDYLIENREQYQEVFCQTLGYLLSHYDYKFVKVFISLPSDNDNPPLPEAREYAFNYFQKNKTNLQGCKPELYITRAEIDILAVALQNEPHLLGIGEFNPYHQQQKLIAFTTVLFTQHPENNLMNMLRNAKPVQTGVYALIVEKIRETCKIKECGVYVLFSSDDNGELRIFFNTKTVQQKFMETLKKRGHDKLVVISNTDLVSPKAALKKNSSKNTQTSRMDSTTSPMKTTERRRVSAACAEVGYGKKKGYEDSAGQRFEVCLIIKKYMHILNFLTQVFWLPKKFANHLYDPDEFVQSHTDAYPLATSISSTIWSKVNPSTSRVLANQNATRGCSNFFRDAPQAGQKLPADEQESTVGSTTPTPTTYTP